MSVSEATVPRRSGLLNVADIIVAPNAAFDRLRIVPVWGWAFLAASALGIAGALLAMPATQHALQTSLPAQLAASPNIARLPADKQSAAIANATSMVITFTRISFLFVPVFMLIASLVQALVMLVANAAGRGDGTFRKFFALSVTVAVVGSGLYTLLNGAILAVRGADAFDNPAALQALPGLALLAPGTTGAVHGFLSGFNVVFLWASALLAFGMIRVARIPRVTAWSTAALILLGTAALYAYQARQY